MLKPKAGLAADTRRYTRIKPGMLFGFAVDVICVHLRSSAVPLIDFLGDLASWRFM
jgi:hypothetical protein